MNRKMKLYEVKLTPRDPPSGKKRREATEDDKKPAQNEYNSSVKRLVLARGIMKVS